MPKLATQNQFLDLSDYGRPFARYFANQLKSTRFTPIHVTLLFGVSGLVAIYCILQNHYLLASFFIILKSIIDAVDGELARAKNTPSYTGRYLDSIFDIILNFLLLMSICYVSETTLWTTILAFIGIQLQGTLYNYYYVILRHNLSGGDTTSKIFEDKSPIALAGESQKTVDIFFQIYTFVYGIFDSIIHYLDKEAYKVKSFPNWFMTVVSLYGLGFQLLLIAIMLTLNRIEYIAEFLILYTSLILIIIGIRKTFIRP
ncbi:CDP-alcohol phosphatidyltransferase family protein [Flavobacterium aquicola]|uniref:CDP-alcohol phosphatidyltransferase-like enzyme n=1 Tax=Flavobacterium aquicola TaxID=1682742 RepID=A0A3E0ESK9_9FLAO|nr:CDP-alcohol phosphatidyltransferase family protein [Flavobacterium aquicola]REH01126.1 CDP-alcohol phosphatidyltransferase-like enzyme [Flavobacterium aquicola]